MHRKFWPQYMPSRQLLPRFRRRICSDREIDDLASGPPSLLRGDVDGADKTSLSDRPFTAEINRLRLS